MVFRLSFANEQLSSWHCLLAGRIFSTVYSFDVVNKGVIKNINKHNYGLIITMIRFENLKSINSVELPVFS